MAVRFVSLPTTTVAENVYVQSLVLNGKRWDRAWLRHADIADGGTLEFTMGPTASAWGSGLDVLPPSMSVAGQLPVTMNDHASKALKVTLDDGRSARTLIDDDAGTMQRLAAAGTVTFELRDAANADYYTLTSGTEASSGLNWTLEGRKGGGDAWVVLDRRHDEHFTWAEQLRPFRISQPGRYQAYRLRLQGERPVDLAELELLQFAEAVAGVRNAPR